MKAVVFNPVAVTDLDDITGYIAQDSLVAANETAERLGQHPAIGIRPRFSAQRFAGFDSFPPITSAHIFCSITSLKMKLKCFGFCMGPGISRLFSNNRLT